MSRKTIKVAGLSKVGKGNPQVVAGLDWLVEWFGKDRVSSSLGESTFRIAFYAANPHPGLSSSITPWPLRFEVRI